MTDTDSTAWAQRQQAQAAGFDAIGARYDEAFPHRDGQLRAGRAVLDRLPAGARVLDVGCGTGLPTAAQFTAAGCAVTGIDISPVMLDLARRNVPGGTFLPGDIDHPPAGLGGYDAVTAFFSLLMLPRDRITAALRRIHGLLVPGGAFALGMVEADVDDVELAFLGAPVRVTGWHRDELRRQVEAAGFTVDAEHSDTPAPATPDAPPDEIQLFVVAHRP